MYLINEEQNNLETVTNLVGLLFEIEHTLFGPSISSVEPSEKIPECPPGMFSAIAFRQGEVAKQLHLAHRIIQRLREGLHIVEPSPKTMPGEYDARAFR